MVIWKAACQSGRLRTALLGGVALVGVPLTAFLLWAPAQGVFADDATDAASKAIGEDTANILGPDACSKCHAPAYKVWQGTHHFSADKTAPKSDLGKEIMKKLGGPALFKKRKDCTQCHVTMQGAADKAEPKWGISCESCHGAAAKWISIHNDKSKERAVRLGEAEKNGMCRPDKTYKLITNCMECHTVPNEDVINKGGHKTGRDFDPLVFSQGEVRHNFIGSPDNPEPSAERKRELYLIGQVLFLEYGIRGLAKATGDGEFAKAQSGRPAGSPEL
ncbi:MAG: cytochrome c family protein [Planctomycetes bacterium]|nr:cytochrome c family protein [Planctomycetota bacterium]